jgi:hypothetical protein
VAIAGDDDWFRGGCSFMKDFTKSSAGVVPDSSPSAKLILMSSVLNSRRSICMISPRCQLLAYWVVLVDVPALSDEDSIASLSAAAASTRVFSAFSNSASFEL